MTGPCGFCGKNPASGIARVNDVWYCHGDDDPEPTCYMRASWGDTPPSEELIRASALKAMEPALACVYEIAANGCRVDAALANNALNEVWRLMKDSTE